MYRGSFTYRKTGDNLTLESVPFSGGRFVSNAWGRGIPNYYITDHLGSVRLIIDHNGEVIERNNYYPFGKRWEDGSMISDNRHRFNGKEEQAFMSIPYSDYGARQYDSDRLGWNGIDPLAEINPGSSPFAFSNNNPIRFIDHDGRSTAEFSGDEELLDSLSSKKIEPVLITAANEANTLAYYMLPMISFVDAAEQAAADGRWGAWTGNITMGTLEGLAFYFSLGKSNQFVGYLKMSAATAKIANATSRIDKFLAAAGKFERLSKGVKQATIKGGDIEKAYSALAKGGVRTSNGAIRLADGTCIKLYNSSTTGVPSIHINRPNSHKYKIRFEK